MAKTVKTQKAQDNPEIIIQQINVGQLNRGNQTIQTWIRNVKAAERSINPVRRYLLDSYLDMGIDLHLESVVSKRKRAIRTIPFEWEELENDVIKENFQSPWMFELMGEIMDVVFKGHHVIEFMFKDGLIYDVEAIPRQNIYPIEGVITHEMMGDVSKGWNFRDDYWRHYMLEVGKPKDLGLYAKIFPYVLLKRGNLSDFARFNEMFGMPLRVYEYDPHDPNSRDEVTKQAEAQGAAAYVVMPKGTSVNFHEANQTGGSTTYKDFHKIMNDEITIGVLGQLLTTSADGKGSYALGTIHKEVQDDINLEDRLMVEYIFNYPLKNNILIPHGYPLEGIKGGFQVNDELPKEKKAEIWLDMEERIPIAAEDFYNEFGVPHPDEKAIQLWTERKKMINKSAQPGGAGEGKLKTNQKKEAT